MEQHVQGFGEIVKRSYEFMNVVSFEIYAQPIAGIDHFEVMLFHASLRNVNAIQDGPVILELGSVSSLPYQDASFDKCGI